MKRSGAVRLPPKRLPLVGIFCGYSFSLFLIYLMLGNFISSFEQVQFLIEKVVLFVVIVAIRVTIPYMLLFAIWAFARLVFNLPAVILTPAGLVNHSIIYQIVVPWNEIEAITRFVPKTSQASRHWWRMLDDDDDILVIPKDKQRLHAMQQPVTKALLRLFNSLHPEHISMAMTAGTQDMVWAQL
jgi:hypothetical protein